MSKEWREVGPNGGDTIDLKKSAPGTSYEGTYIGNRKITTTYGDNTVYTFEGADGPFSIYGFTDLNAKLGEVEQGSDVRLTYEGKETVNTKTRGKVQMHRVRVEVAVA